MARRLHPWPAPSSLAMLSLVIASLAPVFALGAGSASCSSFSSTSDDPPASNEAGADAATATCSADLTRDPANCGACGVSCPATAACENGACRPGCADKKVYVSATGDDQSDGCAITRPMKTIGGALARVKAIGAKDHEVDVCRGSYRERSLTIDFPVSLRGGFECSQFTRTKDFGYPLFDATTDTSIEDDNVGADRATLTVTGAAVTRATLIDGFTVRGAADGNARSVAISVENGAMATLSDLVVEGGGTTAATGSGSRGIATSAASPEIMRSVIHGGTGTATDRVNADSLGLHVTGGSPIVHEVKVTGSTGALRLRGFGVLVDGAAVATGANAWHDVVFSGGPATFASIGLYIAGGATLELVHGDLSGGLLDCQVASCEAIGALVFGGTASIASSRIYGGETSALSDTSLVPTLYGVFLAQFTAPGPTVLTNDVIVPGNFNRSAIPRLLGVYCAETSGSRLVHNTIIVPEAAGGRSTETTAVWASDNATQLEIDDNLFVGETGAIATGVRLDRDGCNFPNPSSIKELRANAFVNTARVVDLLSGSPCAENIAQTITDVPALLPGIPTDGNVRLASSCGADPASACVTCATATTCAGRVLSPWSAAAGGSPSLAELAGPSYTMPAGAPCAVAKGAVLLTPPVAMDAKGLVRTSPASIGASQITGVCAAN